MKLRRRRSANVEDRRGQSPMGGGGMSFPGLGGGSGGGGGLGGGGLPIGKGGGIGLVIVLIVLAVCVAPRLGGDGGGDLGDILGGDPFSGFGEAQPGNTTTPLDPDDKLFGFVNAVVDDVNITWTDIFAESDQRYEEATTVVFEDSTSTACGRGSAATGPFYCPADSRGLHRPVLLRGAARPLRRAGRLRPGLRDRPRGTATTSRTCSASPTRCSASAARIQIGPTSCRCGWSCRPTAWPACGVTRRSAQGGWSEGDLEEALGGGRGDRRRPHPGARPPGRIDPETLDPRHFGPAGEVVPHRLRLGRPGELRHVPGRSAVIASCAQRDTQAMNSSRSRWASIAATVAGSSVWSRSGSSTSSFSP